MGTRDIFSDKELESLNLEGKKGDVFCVLLDQGSLTASEISFKSGIKRTTCYDLLNELLIQGAIEVNESGKTKKYRVIDPKHFKHEAKQRLLAIEEILPRINKIYENAPGKPRVRYFEGMDGYIKICEELLELNRGDEYYYFDVAMSMIDRRGISNLKKYVNERINKGIWSNSIRVKNSEVDAFFLASAKKNLRRVRYFPREISTDFTAMYIYNGKVGFVPTKSESYSMIIDSPELFSSMKILWDIIWEISSPG